MRRLGATVTLALVACTSASPDPGYDALLQVEGAQWRPGPAPAAANGPAVESVLSQRATLLRDASGQRVAGALGAGATALWVGLDGDDGGWIVPAGPPSVDAPDQPSFALELALAASVPLGPITLRLLAVDAAGRPGAPRALALVADDLPPPAGELVIALGWSGAADLDLHVVAPDGGEAWAGDPNTWEPPPPGTPSDPIAWRSGGRLDHDGNRACRRDPRPREHVIWSVPPPAGRYLVRVDARSLCGDAVGYWYAAVYRDGGLEPLATAAGIATVDHTRLPHGTGAGITAIELDLPP